MFLGTWQKLISKMVSNCLKESSIFSSTHPSESSYVKKLFSLWSGSEIHLKIKGSFKIIVGIAQGRRKPLCCHHLEGFISFFSFHTQQPISQSLSESQILTKVFLKKSIKVGVSLLCRCERELKSMTKSWLRGDTSVLSEGSQQQSNNPDHRLVSLIVMLALSYNSDPKSNSEQADEM